MGPKSFQAPVQDVVALSTYVIRLFREALPDPSDRTLFDRLMYQARTKGLNWIQGLEYVAEHRRSVRC
jgi:hypothetical protein